MSTSSHDHFPAAPGALVRRRPLMIALLMVAAMGGFYLLREHWNHVAGQWVYLLLLACPLMHLLHGHGSHGNHAQYQRQLNRPEDARE